MSDQTINQSMFWFLNSIAEGVNNLLILFASPVILMCGFVIVLDSYKPEECYQDLVFNSQIQPQETYRKVPTSQKKLLYDLRSLFSKFSTASYVSSTSLSENYLLFLPHFLLVFRFFFLTTCGKTVRWLALTPLVKWDKLL